MGDSKLKFDTYHGKVMITYGTNLTYSVNGIRRGAVAVLGEVIGKKLVN